MKILPIHLFLPFLQVMDSVNENGSVKMYDGCDDSVLNFNGYILFTHEFLLSFLDHGAEGRISFSGFWRACIKGWKRSYEGFYQGGDLKEDVPAAERAYLTILDRPFMKSYFLAAVFDMITLLQIDYHSSMRCECGKYTNDENMMVIYDNACKVLQSMMLRCPQLARYINLFIDTMHYAGHEQCSPLFNQKGMLAVTFINAEINEQKNKLLRHVQTSMSFLGQIRGLVYIRYFILT